MGRTGTGSGANTYGTAPRIATNGWEVYKKGARWERCMLLNISEFTKRMKKRRMLPMTFCPKERINPSLLAMPYFLITTGMIPLTTGIGYIWETTILNGRVVLPIQ